MSELSTDFGAESTVDAPPAPAAEPAWAGVTPPAAETQLPGEAVAPDVAEVAYIAEFDQEVERRVAAMVEQTVAEFAQATGLEPADLLQLIYSGEAAAAPLDPLAVQLFEEERQLELERDGAARVQELVSDWNTRGGLSVDPQEVRERALDIVAQFPPAVRHVALTESDEFAVGLLRKAFESVATEQAGTAMVWERIQEEARLLDVDLSDDTATRIYGLANGVLHVFQKQESDPAVAAEKAIAFATRKIAGRDEKHRHHPADIHAVTTHYAPRIREEATAAPDVRVPGKEGQLRAVERDEHGRFKASTAIGLSGGLSRVTAKHAELMRQSAERR